MTNTYLTYKHETPPIHVQLYTRLEAKMQLRIQNNLNKSTNECRYSRKRRSWTSRATSCVKHGCKGTKALDPPQRQLYNLQRPTDIAILLGEYIAAVRASFVQVAMTRDGDPSGGVAPPTRHQLHWPRPLRCPLPLPLCFLGVRRAVPLYLNPIRHIVCRRLLRLISCLHCA